MSDRENVIPRAGDIYVLHEGDARVRLLWRIVHIIRAGTMKIIAGSADVDVDVAVVDHTGQIRTFKDVSMASSVWSYGLYELVREER